MKEIQTIYKRNDEVNDQPPVLEVKEISSFTIYTDYPNYCVITPLKSHVLVYYSDPYSVYILKKYTNDEFKSTVYYKSFKKQIIDKGLYEFSE